MNRKLFFLLALFFIAISTNLKAEDFSAVNNGDTIYYNITSSISPRTVGVTYRGSSYASYSNEYSGAISVPDSVLYSGNYYKVTSISRRAFSDCNGLISNTIPNSVTSIGDYAFYGCGGLTSITIPNSVTSIGGEAFYGTPFYNNKPNGVVYINNVLYKYKDTMPANTSINIQSGTVSISGYAFSSCSGLTSITIQNSITSIGDYAFCDCTGLTSITIPNSVTSIGNNAFYGTPFYNNKPNGVVYINNILYKYKGTMPTNASINILSGTISVSSCAFYGCGGLNSITIPNSVTSIGNYAFRGCSGLNSITIPNSITSISDGAFYNCSSITSVTIPNTVTSIGDLAFYNCSGLTSVTIPNSVTSIGSGAFCGCTGLTSITIPNSVTSIGEQTFGACTSLTSITLPSSITSIGDHSFSDCSSLTSITLPSYITSIGDHSFSDCSSLTSITLPSSITSIGNYAFEYCSSLSSIKSYAIYPPTISSYSFDGVYKFIPLYVPCISISNYQSALYWNYFTNIKGGSHRIPQYIEDSICDGDFYTNYGANIDSAGVYYLVSGCDSVILTLTVNSSYNSTYYDTICKGGLYNKNGFNFIADTSRIFFQYLQTINGCDSIIKLNLSVTPLPITPNNLSVQLLTNYLEVVWQGNASDYEVYRNDTLVATLSQPIYLDYNVINSNIYCYKIKASNGSCESDFSNIACKSYLSLENGLENIISTKLYPNPTNNKAVLEIEGMNGKAEIKVMDLAGRTLKTYTINTGYKQLEIDVQGFAKGVYNLSISTSNSNIMKKLIVN